MYEEPIVFSGGVAKNIGVVKAIEEVPEKKLIVPKEPQITAALGGAIYAKEQIGQFPTPQVKVDLEVLSIVIPASPRAAIGRKAEYGVSDDEVINGIVGTGNMYCELWEEKYDREN